MKIFAFISAAARLDLMFGCATSREHVAEVGTAGGEDFRRGSDAGIRLDNFFSR